MSAGATADYLVNLDSVDVRPLEELLAIDTKNWTNNLIVAKEDAERIETELNAVIQERKKKQVAENQHR